eukprot:3723085-Pyramimonas_sp.AAC.1
MWGAGRGKLQVRAVLKEPTLSKSTCDLETIKSLQQKCKGLNGVEMETCWAEWGCDVEEVTREFASVVADIKSQHDGGWGHGRLHTVNHYSAAAAPQRPIQAKAAHGRLHAVSYAVYVDATQRQSQVSNHGRLHSVNRYQ